MHRRCRTCQWALPLVGQGRPSLAIEPQSTAFHFYLLGQDSLDCFWRSCFEILMPRQYFVCLGCYRLRIGRAACRFNSSATYWSLETCSQTCSTTSWNNHSISHVLSQSSHCDCWHGRSMIWREETDQLDESFAYGQSLIHIDGSVWQSHSQGGTSALKDHRLGI
mgnify:CR=1 FL=1